MYYSQYPNGFNGNVPSGGTRYGALQITGITNNQQVVANITYIFVTTLGTPIYVSITASITSSSQAIQKTFGTQLIPAGYGLYIAGRSSGSNNTEYIDFKISAISYLIP